MPNIKSAKKRVNVIKRQSEENIPVRGSMRTALKKAVKDSSNQNLVNDAIKKRKPLPGLICHSDKGSVFRSKLYRKLLAENHFIYSYTRLNHSCDDNAAQESFHATLKKEWLSTKTLYHYEDAYREIFKFIEGFYNPKRLHSSLGYVSPITIEKNYYLKQKMSKTPSK